MNPEHKKYILENAGKKSPARIASELGIKERKVKKILRMQRKGGDPSGEAAPGVANTPARQAPARKIAALASVALIMALGFAVYANSLNGKFLFDDEHMVVNNAFIKSPSLLPKVFGADIGKGAATRYGFYRPIQMVTYAADYSIWRLNTVGYHLTNILLHVLVALCVYRLINIFFGDRFLSAVTAVLFAVHPVHTTVVSSISARAESLYLLFMLAAFIFYVKSLKTGSALSYLMMMSSYFLSLLSKENALIFPALLLLYHYTFRQKVRMKEFVPVSGAAVLYVLFRMTALKHLMYGVVDKGSLFQRIPGAFAAVAGYFRLMLLPLGLHIEYGEKLFSPADPRAIAGLALVICLIWFIFKTAKARGLLFFSLSWFFITLLPVLNLYPLNAYMSENWLYLPSIGFFLALAGSLTALFKMEKFRALALILLFSLAAFYSYLTIRQNEVWREPIPFYEKMLKYSPDSSKMRSNLGTEYYSKGRQEDAIAMYKKAIELDPYNFSAYNNLGNIYNNTGRNAEAVAMYEKALYINGGYADAYNNLGVVYYRMGKREDAVASYKRALRINPNHAVAYGNLADLYFNERNYDTAVKYYDRAVSLGYKMDPDVAKVLEPFHGK